MLKTLFGLGVLGTVYWRKKLRDTPQYFHHPESSNISYLKKSVFLKHPYVVSPWFTNPHLQIIYHTIKQQQQQNDLPLIIEDLSMPDGGITQLAWLNQETTPDTPTIVILHTITGSPRSMKTMLEDLSKLTSWRIVMCLRRGHTLQHYPFTKINLMGDVPDLKIQIEHIQQKFPKSSLYAVGSSAGTALLARYLGEVNKETPFKAAFAYAPGYNLETAFNRIASPYDWYMARKIKKAFFKPHHEQLTQLEDYQEILKIKRLSQLQKSIYHLAGFDSYDDYLQACNPIQVFSDVAIPTLILNAEDDPICHIDNAKQYLYIVENNPFLTLLTTKYGSHCMHYQGWRRPKSWAHLLIADYFLHQHQIAQSHLNA